MLRRLFMGVLGVALFASTLAAQARGGGGGGFPGGFPGAGPRVDKSETFKKELKLSDEQKTVVESILDESQKQALPLIKQWDLARNALLQVDLASKPADEAVKNLAAIQAQVLSLEVKACSDILAKLEEKQKSKAPKLFELMDGIFLRGNWRRTN